MNELKFVNKLNETNTTIICINTIEQENWTWLKVEFGGLCVSSGFFILFYFILLKEFPLIT